MEGLLKNSPAEIVVDMGLPSGVKWASCDIDVSKPGGFCDTPFTYEKSFFSWGNIEGHSPINEYEFDYDFGSFFDLHERTQGSKLIGNIDVGKDFYAARANLGAPWRMPTIDEFAELFDNSRYINADGTEVDTREADKRVIVNGVRGLYLESKINGARLFFSASGFGSGRSWCRRGTSGYYWSSTFYSARYARNLSFYSGGVHPQLSSNRCNGFPVRPVQ